MFISLGDCTVGIQKSNFVDNSTEGKQCASSSNLLVVLENIIARMQRRRLHARSNAAAVAPPVDTVENVESPGKSVSLHVLTGFDSRVQFQSPPSRKDDAVATSSVSSELETHFEDLTIARDCNEHSPEEEAQFDSLMGKRTVESITVEGSPMNCKQLAAPSPALHNNPKRVSSHSTPAAFKSAFFRSVDDGASSLPGCAEVKESADALCLSPESTASRSSPGVRFNLSPDVDDVEETVPAKSVPRKVLIINSASSSGHHTTVGHQENEKRANLLTGEMGVGCLRRQKVDKHLKWVPDSEMRPASIADLLRYVTVSLTMMALIVFMCC